MQSSTLLQDLCKLPVTIDAEQKSFKGLVTELVFSDIYLRTAERDRLHRALAEIERLTNTKAACAFVQGADDAVRVILNDSTIDARATRFGLRIAQALTPAGTAASLIASTALGVAHPVAGIVPHIVSSMLKKSKARAFPDEVLDSIKTKLVLDYVGLTLEDVFYFKNRRRIDSLAERLQETARTLATQA